MISPTIESVREFVYREASTLNDERYADWLELITEDFEYRMPAPMSRDDPAQPRHSPTSLLSWESIHSLRLRFERTLSDYAWADRPPALHRRHVTAIRVAPVDPAHPTEVRVDSDVLVFRSRSPEGNSIVSATRQDVLRVVGAGLALARRTVYLDADRVDLAQIALLF